MNKTERESLAARLAENSIVLLKNENDVLPLASGDTIAVFGRAQTGTLFFGKRFGRSSSWQGARHLLGSL